MTGSRGADKMTVVLITCSVRRPSCWHPWYRLQVWVSEALPERPQLTVVAKPTDWPFFALLIRVVPRQRGQLRVVSLQSHRQIADFVITREGDVHAVQLLQ